MLIIAVIGLVVNVVVAFILGGHDHAHAGHDNEHNHEHEAESNHKKRNLNVQSAFLHVLGDAISSVGVIVAAIIIQFTKIEWIDPLISILIGVIIFISAFRVLKSAMHILLEGVPEGLSIKEINTRMSTVESVKTVHDLHVWNLGSDQVSLSAHVILQDSQENQQSAVMDQLKKLLEEEFQIQHTTIQFENKPCGGGHGGCN